MLLTFLASGFLRGTVQADSKARYLQAERRLWLGEQMSAEELACVYMWIGDRFGDKNSQGKPEFFFSARSLAVSFGADSWIGVTGRRCVCIKYAN